MGTFALFSVSAQKASQMLNALAHSFRSMAESSLWIVCFCECRARISVVPTNDSPRPFYSRTFPLAATIQRNDRENFFQFGSSHLAAARLSLPRHNHKPEWPRKGSLVVWHWYGCSACGGHERCASIFATFNLFDCCIWIENRTQYNTHTPESVCPEHMKFGCRLRDKIGQLIQIRLYFPLAPKIGCSKKHRFNYAY